MYRKSQSLIEESYEKSLIKLVEITGLLFVKSETQDSVQKKTTKSYGGNKQSWISRGSRCVL